MTEISKDPGPFAEKPQGFGFVEISSPTGEEPTPDTPQPSEARPKEDTRRPNQET
jgi:hypothetical protein